MQVSRGEATNDTFFCKTLTWCYCLDIMAHIRTHTRSTQLETRVHDCDNFLSPAAIKYGRSCKGIYLCACVCLLAKYFTIQWSYFIKKTEMNNWMYISILVQVQ